jgi:hypothetical protein
LLAVVDDGRDYTVEFGFCSSGMDVAVFGGGCDGRGGGF